MSSGASKGEGKMAALPPGSGERHVLYYRNAMGLADTSPVPKKDAMGMDYIAVYADDGAAGGNRVRVSSDRIQKLGLSSAPVLRQVLNQTIRVTGVLQADERRQTVVALKFDGWIEHLDASATGQSIHAGDILMRVYSPEIMQTEREYLAAKSLPQVGDDNGRGAGLATAALRRLRNLDIPDAEIRRLDREGTAAHSFVVPSLNSGIVLEKIATEGQHFAPGDVLLRLTDISRLWVIGSVPEQDLAKIAVGQAARMTLATGQGEILTGKVGFIYPDIDPATRTGRVRIDLPNPRGGLKIGQYAAVDLAAGGGRETLTIPASAILDDGVSQSVLIDHGDGSFEPRAVRIGRRGGELVEILAGLALGDKVVVSANFLIDAESNLQAALRGFSQKAAPPAAGKRNEP
jgi:Cu(I)/Ag(I) efflux system membrane fusion protein